ncbi:MAG: HEAT repeat domain-containing protein [Oscillatoriales cyanobacterium SM2_2_1]|nr:HEAT repeat domain-containing protein [Oscillatoriales cyanobacterium SM2_2_1]
MTESLTMAALQGKLSDPEMGVRMGVLNQSRHLDDRERWQLMQVAAKDANARIRYGAISQMATLGHVDGAAAAELLGDALCSDPEIDVRAAAADALGALKFHGAFPILAEVFAATNDWLLQFSVVAALGELGNPEAFDLLERATLNPNELVRIAAIGALGELGDSRALPVLLRFTADPDWQIRHRVAQALGTFGYPEARQALDQLQRDESSQVAEAAQLAIANYLST